MKYSHATRLHIALHYPSNQVILKIEDNGQGFDMGQQTAGLGQSSMQERARPIGAVLTIDSTLGMGTRTSLIWPSSS